jgi:hypothetical protein
LARTALCQGFKIDPTLPEPRARAEFKAAVVFSVNMRSYSEIVQVPLAISKDRNAIVSQE